jgi:protein involved in polysaccharide export with SLBB domain
MALSDQSDNEQKMVPGVALKALVLWFFVLMASCCGLAAQEGIEQSTPPPGAIDSSYTLGPGDRIKISIFNQGDLSGEYVLDGDGRFSMPLIGSVQAAGLSPSDLEALLVSKLKPDYLVNPRIFIQMTNYRPYYLIGEVQGTGAFPYVAGMTYLTAVAIAGGFTYRAKKEFVYVIHGDDPEQEEVKLSVEEKVRPGDIIRVAERLF